MTSDDPWPTLEFQSYVTKTHSLRKVFISVKGIYYQASIYGQEVTWLTPHALAQTLPEDVDYRVMLTFLEFYIAMMGFINYKLYYDRSFRYPPVLDTRLEDAAGGIVAVIHDLADKVAGAAAGGKGGDKAIGAKKKSAQAKQTEARLGSLQAKLADIAANEVDEEEEAAAAAKAARSDDEDDDDDVNDDEDGGEGGGDEEDMDDIIAASAGADPAAGPSMHPAHLTSRRRRRFRRLSLDAVSTPLNHQRLNRTQKKKKKKKKPRAHDKRQRHQNQTPRQNQTPSSGLGE